MLFSGAEVGMAYNRSLAKKLYLMVRSATNVAEITLPISDWGNIYAIIRTTNDYFLGEDYYILMTATDYAERPLIEEVNLHWRLDNLEHKVGRFITDRAGKIDSYKILLEEGQLVIAGRSKQGNLNKFYIARSRLEM